MLRYIVVLTAVNNEESNDDDGQVQDANEVQPEAERHATREVAGPCRRMDVL